MHPSYQTTPNRPSTGNGSNSKYDSSRNSFYKSTPTPRVNYPKCDLKKQHSKQIMNLICITESCKLRGPICILCKSSEHANHIVLPIKKFLQNVEENILQKMSSCNQKNAKKQEQIKIKTEPSPLLADNCSLPISQPFETNAKMLEEQEQSKRMDSLSAKTLQKLNECKDKMLYKLAQIVNSVSEKIREIQQKIILQSNKHIQKADVSANYEVKLKKLTMQLKEINQSQMVEADSFRCGVSQLLSMIKCQSKQKYVAHTEGLEQIRDQFTRFGDNFCANIEHWSLETDKILDKVFSNNPSIISKKNQKDKEKEKNPDEYRFSSELKMKSIVLSNENKVAKQAEKLGGIVLISGPLLKERKIKIKILSLSNSIILGVALKNIVKDNQFKLVTSSIGHGSYMIGHNSYIYSHHNKTANMVMKGMPFSSGEQITITMKGDTLSFMKKSEPKSITLQMKKLDEQEWKQLSFGVFLGGSGDKVQILQ